MGRGYVNVTVLVNPEPVVDPATGQPRRRLQPGQDCIVITTAGLLWRSIL